MKHLRHSQTNHQSTFGPWFEVLKRQTWVVVLVVIVSAMGSRTAIAEDEGPIQLRETFLLTGKALLKAFESVAKTSQPSTVQLMTKDEQVGLGAIVDSGGWIVSKASQIKAADVCKLSDGQKLEFEYVGYHPKHDLALIKIDRKDLTPVQWAQEPPQLGDWLITVGASSEVPGAGVMSAPRRKIPRAEVYGVLGIELARDRTATIQRVFPNSGALRAGLKSSDVVLAIDALEIATGIDLIRTVRRYRPGDTLTLTIRREEDELKVPVTLTHPFGDFLSRIAFQKQMGGALSFRRDDFEDVYQHDTVLAPEACGGPVVNVDGKVVGINIARAGRTESYILTRDVILSVLEDMKSGQFPPPAQVTAQPDQTDLSQTKTE